VDLELARAYCLDKPGTLASYPFGPGALVMKVGGKIFAILSEDELPAISLKCEPEIATLLRSSHRSVKPGYHLNKRHWNTVSLDGTIDSDRIREWIDDSYDLVVGGLPRAVRNEIMDAAE
jgi:predicted DNA-binding protein (MmcQ/YjbR family)